MSIPTRYVAAIAIPPNANCRTEPSHSGFRVRWAAAAPAISRPMPPHTRPGHSEP